MRPLGFDPVPCESSWIAATCQRGSVLLIYKRDGEILLYAGVPLGMHGALHRAKSVGTAYNNLIKGRGYDYLRIPALPKEAANESSGGGDPQTVSGAGALLQRDGAQAG